MKQNNLLQYIILYVIVACVALAIAALARMFTVSVGFDGFTAFIVFVVALAVQVVVYLSIQVVLQNMMLPWIGNGLAKIPYFRKKIEEKEAKIDIPESDVSLDDIRNEQQKKHSQRTGRGSKCSSRLYPKVICSLPFR